MLRVPAFMREAYSIRLVCWPAGSADDSNLSSLAMSSCGQRDTAGEPTVLGLLSYATEPRRHLDVLLMRGDDALAHEEAEVVEEGAVLLRLLLALVQQEADHSLLQDVAELPAAKSEEASVGEEITDPINHIAVVLRANNS